MPIKIVIFRKKLSLSMTSKTGFVCLQITHCIFSLFSTFKSRKKHAN